MSSRATKIYSNHFLKLQENDQFAVMIGYKSKSFNISDIQTYKEKAWKWSETFDYFSILENNKIPYFHDPFINVLAVGARELLTKTSLNSFNDLGVFCRKNSSWIFGYLSYDLKNQIENLQSNNHDFKQFQELFFFVPKHLIFFYDHSVEIFSIEDPKEIHELILSSTVSDNELANNIGNGDFIDKKEYIKNVEKIKEHIINGDIYELNYCIEFAFDRAKISPLDTFKNLIAKSPMPFSTLIRAKDNFIICSSPERFLKKSGDQLISQPIKGTIKRGIDKKEDLLLKEKLENSEKEIAENLMIVDLVRNDLAKSSKPGSVQVEELFGIYSFKGLHQMISTVSSIKREHVNAVEAIKNAFPMGSMTGAPKIKAMELIEKYESSKRGVYSGAAGYFTPEMDFDFNVLIRSIFYNHAEKKLSFQVGSAITYDADAEYEYQECLLKAKAIFEVLGLQFAG